MTLAPAPSYRVEVDPALAETVVFRRLASLPLDDTRAATHRARVEPLYLLGDPETREAAFSQLAMAEFHELRLAEPIARALAERPRVAQQLRVLLLGEARGRGDEGLTAEPVGEHLGVKVEASRFDDAPSLLGWARHTLGHAEDTFDPAFGFEPGWDASPARRSPAVRGRLHRLWDVSVDARLSAPGRTSRAMHAIAIAGDLPGVEPSAVGRIVEALWAGPRPSFAQLLAWAERPTSLVADIAPEASGSLRAEHCPLCNFPSTDVEPPGPAIAALVVAEYPVWRPEHGLCARCADRFLLSGPLWTTTLDASAPGGAT